MQAKRNEAIKRLSDGRVNVLVATDIAARGIDINDVSHVFNFDLPRTSDTYLHRIGRTGRAGRKGCAISFVEAHDHLLLGKISRYLNEPLKPRVIDELRPTTKAPSAKTTGNRRKSVGNAEREKEKEKEKVKVKVRHRDSKISVSVVNPRRKPTNRLANNSYIKQRNKKGASAPFLLILDSSLQTFCKSTGDNIALLLWRQ